MNINASLQDGLEARFQAETGSPSAAARVAQQLALVARSRNNGKKKSFELSALLSAGQIWSSGSQVVLDLAVGSDQADELFDDGSFARKE